MAELPILAYGFAGTFKLSELAACFAGARLTAAKSHVVAEYEEDRYAVAFDFGALVFVNVSAEERARVIGGIMARLAAEEPHPPLEEDFFLEVRPGVPPEGEVKFERVIVSTVTKQVVELVTLLFAQSVCIDYYEEDLQEILKVLATKSGRMARQGRVSGSARDLARFVGSTITTKNQIIAALAVLDKPAATWEDEALDHLYRELREMLEIDERFRALEYKLRTIQDSLELFLDLAQTRRMLWLEATIVVLILIELTVSLWRALG